jgi:hypothetical protein
MRPHDLNRKPHNNFLICQVANTDSKEAANASASQVTEAESTKATNASNTAIKQL